LASPAAAVTGPGGVPSGPFVPTGPVSTRGLTLSAFGGHARGRPFIDRVHVLPSREPASLDGDFRSGRVGVALGTSDGSVVGGSLLLVFDSRRPPFDRPEMRSVVAAAIDGRDLVDHLIPGGDATPSLLPPVLLPPLPSPAPRGAPPAERANAGSLSMRVSREVSPLVSQRIVAYLGQLGFKVDAQPALAGSSTGSRGPHMYLVL